jgi:flagellar export protein FliJ
MAGKKSAEIATLIRVQSWSVDEERRMLGQMQDREAALLEDRDRMDKELLNEQAVAAANPTLAGHSYAAYAFNYRERRANLEAVIAAVRVEIEQQRERLANAYKELKVLEEVQDNWLGKERIEAARIEQIALDEIAQTLYQRAQRI